jgi:hypothetical protein
MKKILNHLINSFNNGNEGFSSKKLTAFAVMLCVVAAHVKWITLGDFSELEVVLTIDFSFVSVLYGINVADKNFNPGQSGSDEKPKDDGKQN